MVVARGALVDSLRQTQDLVDLLDDEVLVFCREETRDLRELVFEVCAVARWHAAGDENLIGLDVRHLVHAKCGEDGIEALLHGACQEGAGVDDGEVRLCRLVDDHVVGSAQQGAHLVRVDLVFGAAKRDEGDIFSR